MTHKKNNTDINKEMEDWNPNETSLPWISFSQTQELYGETYAKYLFSLECYETYVQGQKIDDI